MAIGLVDVRFNDDERPVQLTLTHADAHLLANALGASSQAEKAHWLKSCQFVCDLSGAELLAEIEARLLRLLEDD